MNVIRLVLIFLICNFSLAQNPYFERYSVEEGLPTSNIYSVFEDSFGYIWFTTDTGILRYDGYDFKNFTTDDGLPDNEVFKIFEDSKKRLWFFTLNGKIGYYKEGKFYNETNAVLLREAAFEKMIVDIVEDENNYIYILYRSGDVTIIKDNAYDKIESKLTSSYALWKVDGKKLIVNSKEIIDINSKKIVAKHNLNLKSFVRYTTDGKGNFFYTTQDSIYKFNKEGLQPFTNVKTKEIINLSLIDGVLYIGTRNGLYIKEKETILHYFKDERISDIHKDSQGNLWVTTLDSGIKFIPKMSILNTIFNSKNKSLNSIFIDSKGDRWYSAYNNVFRKKNKGIAKAIPNYRPFSIKEIEGRIYMFSNKLIISEDDITWKIPARVNDIVKNNDYYFIATSSYIARIPEKKLVALLVQPELFEKEMIKHIIFKKRVNFLLNNKDDCDDDDVAVIP